MAGDAEPAHRLLAGRPIADLDLARQLNQVALGDLDAFRAVYDQVAAPVLGVIRRVVRDPAQAEEVTQEVLLDVWRTASRFEPNRGSAMAWVLTIAHRRAVDRVRSASRSAAREARVVDSRARPDEVAEAVEIVLEHQRVLPRHPH
jgi:RNA polymerase sigma-70 factor (ECF subfamily)